MPDRNATGHGSGEKPGDREAMRRVERRIREDGVPSDKAREMARESMLRTDRRLRDKGDR